MRLDPGFPTADDVAPLAVALWDAAPDFALESAPLLARHGIEPGPAGDFTLRLRQPAGRLAAGQFLALDDIADRYGDGALRLLPRQGIALAGVLKRDLKDAIGALDLASLTTFGAGGAIASVAAAAPRRTPAHRRLENAALRLSDHLLPSRRAYDALWLDRERAPRAGERPEASGPPRRLEIGLALPEDDAIDVLSSDLAIIALDDGERLEGYNLALGGEPRGLAATPRRASPIGFVAPEALLDTAAAVLRVYGEGDRAIKAALGRTLPPPRPMPQLRVQNHRGWHEQGDGRLYLGLPIPDDRIADRATGVRLRTALRLVCRDFAGDVLVTPQRDVILADIARGDRLAVEAALARFGIARGEHGVRGDAPSLKEAS
jgi:sulfite reductase (ferredoxin)